MTAYANYAIGAAKAIRDSLGSTATDAAIAADVDAMWKFESELAKVNTHRHFKNSTLLKMLYFSIFWCGVDHFSCRRSTKQCKFTLNIDL